MITKDGLTPMDLGDKNGPLFDIFPNIPIKKLAFQSKDTDYGKRSMELGIHPDFLKMADATAEVMEVVALNQSIARPIFAFWIAEGSGYTGPISDVAFISLPMILKNGDEERTTISIKTNPGDGDKILKLVVGNLSNATSRGEFLQKLVKPSQGNVENDSSINIGDGLIYLLSDADDLARRAFGYSNPRRVYQENPNVFHSQKFEAKVGQVSSPKNDVRELVDLPESEEISLDLFVGNSKFFREDPEGFELYLASKKSKNS